jgi:hypothetical protein
MVQAAPRELIFDVGTCGGVIASSQASNALHDLRLVNYVADARPLAATTTPRELPPPPPPRTPSRFPDLESWELESGPDKLGQSDLSVNGPSAPNVFVTTPSGQLQLAARPTPSPPMRFPSPPARIAAAVAGVGVVLMMDDKVRSHTSPLVLVVPCVPCAPGRACRLLWVQMEGVAAGAGDDDAVAVDDDADDGEPDGDVAARYPEEFDEVFGSTLPPREIGDALVGDACQGVGRRRGGSIGDATTTVAFGSLSNGWIAGEPRL